MKIVKGILFALYVFIYVYAAHKTNVEPDRLIWGYICTGIFGFLFIWLVTIIVKNQKNSEKK